MKVMCVRVNYVYSMHAIYDHMNIDVEQQEECSHESQKVSWLSITDWLMTVH